ncbi:hypothetical protein [Ammoniphilus sp. CFH 90114]|uniref:transmembrane-type terpene cyclase n=1 Tax=Ammoniphilus sp. CFH 90114 TaxID=2493665 RepID=UPI00100EA6B9|nr:hypothetical protein [Ammoniphilus sp. CFH 90114]RXT15410.1 hypothetical protein EIZ39_04220 [Ammoniphilus sp. CFH 90114]
MNTVLIFTIAAGGLWILTYLLLIYRGFRDRKCGMPFAALCGNITWEYIFSFIFPVPGPGIYIIYIWFLLDIIILIQFLLYSRDDLPKPLSHQLFLPTLVVSLATAFSLHYFIALEFSNFTGVYSAYGLNLMMSILFVHLRLSRNHLLGQSMTIAICKLAGTVFASLVSYALYPTSVLLLLLYILVFFFDLLYVILLHAKKKDLDSRLAPL